MISSFYPGLAFEWVFLPVIHTNHQALYASRVHVPFLRVVCLTSDVVATVSSLRNRLFKIVS